MKRILFLLMAALAIASCQTTRYVPVESTKVDSVYFNTIVRDSIYMRDSIYVREKGDTVFINKYKYIYKDVAVHDTLYSVKTDSIRIPYPVEAQLTKWQRVRMDIGGCAVLVIIVVLIVFLSRFFLHRRVV